MYVAADVFTPGFVLLTLILNPFERASRTVMVAPAEVLFANKYSPTTFDGFLEASKIAQFLGPDVDLTITNLGLNPVNINGPSLEPLPVYEPNAL